MQTRDSILRLGGAAASLGLLLWFSGIAAAGADDEVRVHPVPVSAGCVLFLIRPDESSGVREEALHVFDPTLHSEPRLVLSIRSNLKLLRRIDQHRFLMQTHHRPRGFFVIDLAAGSCRTGYSNNTWRLDHREGRLEFLDSREAVTYFLEERSERADRTDRTLMCFDLGNTSPARAVCDLHLTRILELGEDDAWGVTQDGGIWRIPLHAGAPTRIAALDPDGSFVRFTHEFSLNRRFLAIGFTPSHDGLNRARLLVFDVTTSDCVLREEDIDIRPSRWSSLGPTLQMTWADDSRIRYSVTEGFDLRPREDDHAGSFAWVEEDIRTGKRSSSHRYSGLLLDHKKPPPGPGWEPPPEADVGTRSAKFFSEIDGGICFLGDSEPMGMPYSEREVSPDGKWAAFMRDTNAAKQPSYGSGQQGDHPAHAVMFADGAKREYRVLVREWAYDFRWFPAVR